MHAGWQEDSECIVAAAISLPHSARRAQRTQLIRTDGGRQCCGCGCSADGVSETGCTGQNLIAHSDSSVTLTGAAQSSVREVPACASSLSSPCCPHTCWSLPWRCWPLLPPARRSWKQSWPPCPQWSPRTTQIASLQVADSGLSDLIQAQQTIITALQMEDKTTDKQIADLQAHDLVLDKSISDLQKTDSATAIAALQAQDTSILRTLSDHTNLLSQHTTSLADDSSTLTALAARLTALEHGRSSATMRIPSNIGPSLGGQYAVSITPWVVGSLVAMHVSLVNAAIGLRYCYARPHYDLGAFELDGSISPTVMVLSSYNGNIAQSMTFVLRVATTAQLGTPAVLGVTLNCDDGTDLQIYDGGILAFTL